MNKTAVSIHRFSTFGLSVDAIQGDPNMKNIRMKKIGRSFLWIFCAIYAAGSIPALGDVERNESIEGMIDEVSTEELERRLNDLIGANPITLDGESVTITNRDTSLVHSLAYAEQYVFEHMQGLAIDQVDYQFWSVELDEDDDCGLSGRQVVANLTGTTRPEEIVLLGAHLDNIIDEGEDGAGGDIAIGADDNGSGSAALMIAAEILSQHEFERTIRFVAFTGEEQGLCGSEFNAEQSADEGENIVAMLSIDMIGYDSDNDGVLQLGVREDEEGSGDLVIANTFVDVVSAYEIDLDPKIDRDSDKIESDHSEYWFAGYDALYVVEDDHNDFNESLHSLDDDLSKINWEYLTNMTKAIVGTVAHLAESEQSPENDQNPPPPQAPSDESGGGSIDLAFLIGFLLIIRTAARNAIFQIRK